MTPINKNIAVMNQLLDWMTYYGRRLDELQDHAADKWGVIEALREENNRYRDVFCALPQRFFLKDKRHRYILCNERFASDFNKTVEEVIGKHEESLVPGDLAKNRKQTEKRILRSRQADETEEILIIDGQQRAFITMRTPLTDGNGGVSGIFGVSVDVSSYWSRVAELEKRNRQLEDTLAARDKTIQALQRNSPEVQNVEDVDKRHKRKYRISNREKPSNYLTVQLSNESQ
jgi:PAS domain S-box-containing protein